MGLKLLVCMMVLELALPALAATSFASPTVFAPATKKFGQSGQFDYYVFEMTYRIDFCLTHSTDASCASADANQPMSLHGLWPDRNDDPSNKYSFCGYSNNPIGKLPWCSPSIDVKAQMSPDVLNQLSAVMQGAFQRCLYNYEWYTHGTCSGLSVDNYFASQAKVAGTFGNLNHFKQLLIASAGGKVERADLINALVADLGEIARSSILINCRRDKGNREYYFSAVALALDRDNFNTFPSAGSFAKFKTSKSSTCPDDYVNISSPVQGNSRVSKSCAGALL
jgi:ribonuclease T2